MTFQLTCIEEGLRAFTCARWRYAFDTSYTDREKHRVGPEPYDLARRMQMTMDRHSANCTFEVPRHARQYYAENVQYNYRDWHYTFTVTDANGNSAFTTVDVYSDADVIYTTY